MRLRFMTKGEAGWEKEKPDDPSKWLWRHDGTESVAISDADSTYFCGKPDMIGVYQEAWSKENKLHDKRKAAMFFDLDKILFCQEVVD
jgi:hypothetical protein